MTFGLTPPPVKFGSGVPDLAFPYPFLAPQPGIGHVSRNAIDAAAAAMAQATPGFLARGSDRVIAIVLDRYVREGRPGEDRLTARRRIEKAIRAGSLGNAELRLNDLGLTEVPPVIPNVFSLDLSGNALTRLPTLPCDIQYLRLARNQLPELPAVLPSELRVLDVSRNRLAALPDTLPNRLVRMDVQDNGLRALPDRLPRELRILNVAQNRIDLTREAKRRLVSLALKRVSDVTSGGPGVSAARVLRRLDVARCAVNADAETVELKIVSA